MKHQPITSAPANGIIANARNVTPRQFFDAITGRSPEIRAAERKQMLAGCIRAIERGDTYGWPPAMVDECRLIMADLNAEIVL